MTELLAMLAGIIAILVLAYFATRVIGRYGAGMVGAPRTEELCVLRQIPVGRAERLVLVRVHQKCLLLGVAQGGVNVLRELSEEESAKWLETPAPSGGMDFLTALRKSVERKK